MSKKKTKQTKKKTWYKAALIKTMWYQHKSLDHWYKLEDPEIDTHIMVN